MVKQIISIASSLTTGLICLFTLVLLMIVGSLSMLKTGGYESINAMPLFVWISKISLVSSWWLILSLLSLILITINTILCTIRSLIAKTPVTSFLLKISPQIIHTGFLFILLAHLVSSFDSFHVVTTVYEQQGIQLDARTIVGINNVRISTSETGFPTAMSAQVTIYEERREILTKKISPNHPLFYNGMGIYLKNVLPYRSPVALIEISRDRGAIWALTGGLLFFAGNILLVTLKWKHELLNRR